MNSFAFSPSLPETRRVSLVLALRKAGFYSYLDGYNLHTVATSLAVNLVFGTSHWRALPSPADSFAACLAKGRADKRDARQWAVARAFSRENSLAAY